jgi:hypothetical protein
MTYLNLSYLLKKLEFHSSFSLHRVSLLKIQCKILLVATNGNLVHKLLIS